MDRASLSAFMAAEVPQNELIAGANRFTGGGVETQGIDDALIRPYLTPSLPTAHLILDLSLDSEPRQKRMTIPKWFDQAMSNNPRATRMAIG